VTIQPVEAWTQLSLTGEDDHTQFVRDEVLAIDVRHTVNGQRVADLARLGYLPEPVLDPTYGYGSMWTHHRPERLVYGDLDPDKTGPWGVFDFTALPFADRAFASVLYDPPYKLAGSPSENDPDHDVRYGVDVRRSHPEQWALIYDGLAECARVADEYLIVKCQDQVSTFRVRFQTRDITDKAAEFGWELKDRLHLLSYRPQPGGRTQVNARNNFSTFLVFCRE
jgi:hypothetical protein